MTRRLTITQVCNCARDDDEEDVVVQFEEPTVIEFDDVQTFTYGNVIKVNPIQKEVTNAFGRKSLSYVCPICDVLGHQSILTKNIDDECLQCGININWFDINHQ